MELKKLTLGEFIAKGDNDYVFAVQYGKEFKMSVDSLNIGALEDCSFGTIKDILMSMEGEFTFEDQLIAFKNILKDKKIRLDIMCLDFLQFVQELNYIKECLIRLAENEVKLLSNATYDEIADRARIGEDGKDLFQGLEVYMQLRQLVNEDITKIDEVQKMKYSDCLLELYTRNQITKFEKNYERLSRKKP